uniref:Leukocyte cell derived chemotaxin 2 n=1 Tax=Sphenodon punctatus TaxID=8508 RepID=A0A8D0L6J7_SPHPU
MLTTTAVVFAALISSATGRWAKICATQSANKIRGCDSYGCGAYNDQSGGKPHKGVDVICRDGSLVYSPFTGSTKMQAKPFGNRNAIDNGVLLHGSDCCRIQPHTTPKIHLPRSCLFYSASPFFILT